MMRSLLYVPANSERFIAKAAERQADAIILDLEDSVLPQDKIAARAQLADSIQAVRRAGARIFVRVNATMDHQIEDAIAACRGGADGLFVPKVNNPAELEALSSAIDHHEREMKREPLSFVGLIEAPGAVLNAAAIAQAPRLLALATGGEDLAFALGGRPTPAVLHLPKLLVHYAAKAAGLLSLGLLRSVADYTDLDAIEVAVREAREHGFDGATCVHPSVVPLLNAGFAPSADELSWAAKVLEQAETSFGPFALDGQMIDTPVVNRARRLLNKPE